MVYRKILTFFWLFLLCLPPAPAQWGELPHAFTLRATSVYFLNPKTGFILGDSGRILKVTQGGTTIQSINSSTTLRLNKCFFTNLSTGFIVGDKGLLLASTDSGNTWNQKVIFNNINLNDIYFINTQRGFICGDNGLILKTVNGGTDWEFINSGVVYYLTSVFFIHPDTGFIAGSKGTFYKTTDSGISWNLINLNTSELLTSLSLNNKTGYLTGKTGILFKTPDRGISWKQDSISFSGTFYDIGCFDNYCFLSAQNGNIFVKEKNYSWKQETLNVISDIISVAVPGDYVCYAINENGQLFKNCPKAEILFFKTGKVNEIAFTNRSKNFSSFLWDFGDGSTGVENSPTHQYASNGDYPVKLSVVNETGCKDSMEISVTVTSIPEVLFNQSVNIEVLDIYGRTMYKDNVYRSLPEFIKDINSHKEFLVSRLPYRIYFLRIKTSRGDYFIKKMVY